MSRSAACDPSLFRHCLHFYQNHFKCLLEQQLAWYRCTNHVLVEMYGWLYMSLVSAPDPHVTPSRKRVWYLTSDFLVVLSQHVNVKIV